MKAGNRNPIAGVCAYCMLMERIRCSSHIMGFDKVKINTTPLLLLLLEEAADTALSQTARHTHSYTPSDRSHTSCRSHSHPDSYIVGPLPHRHLLSSPISIPAHPFLSLPLLLHRYPYLGVCVLGINIPPSLHLLSSLFFSSNCLLQWTFMTTHSVRVLFSLPLALFLLHSPQVKY